MGGAAAVRKLPRRRRQWRATLRFWHRDIGYLCAGLTLAYAVSGIAVNHRRDWDFNRSRQTTQLNVGGPARLLPQLDALRRSVLESDPASLTTTEAALVAAAIGRKLRMQTPPQNTLWRGRYRLVIYFSVGDADQVEYDVRSGALLRTQRSERPVLRELNYLHLNEGGRWWTYAADAFAVALLFLATSGLIMVRGPQGLRGRGGVLVGVGLVLPVVALIWFRLR